jgi:hypothetical protein
VRILYRARQFWHSVFLKTAPHSFVQAQGQLTPAQWELFQQLQPDEQAHAVSIFRKLLDQGDYHSDLLVAALLHDVGKLSYRLNPIERTWIVVAQALIPGLARRWGSLPPAGWKGLPGWRKAFILAQHHPQWGAELAHQAGVSPLTEALIRGHQHTNNPSADELENDLLHKLWAADNDS